MSIPPPPDNSIAIGACAANKATAPEVTSEQLIESQSAGLATLMEAMGVTSCKTITAAGVSFLPPGAIGGSGTIGCEQIAALSGAIDASQKVFQCAFTNQQTNKSFNANQTLNILIRIVNSKLRCNIVTEQVSNVNVMNYTEFDSEIKQQFNASLEATLQQLVESTQDQVKKGLFVTPADGQKTVQMMTAKLNQLVANQSFVNIVQNVLEAYANRGNITIEVSGSQLLGALNDDPGRPCIKANQQFVMQVISQSVLKSSLSLLFDAELQAQFLQSLKNSQSTKSEGFTLPSFGSIIVILILIVVAIALVLSKKSGSDGNSGPLLSGKTGLIVAIIVLVLGLAVLTTGLILLLATKVSTIVSIAVLVGGAILFFVGISALVKARAASS